MKTFLLACAAMSLATCANAAVVTFNFGTIADTANKTTGDLTNTATFTLSGLTIIAKGFGYTSGTTADLYGKHGGGDENGLGLNNDPTGDHEIHYHSGFVQLDLSSFTNAVLAGTTYFGTDSTTGGEAWTVYGTNTSGSLAGAVQVASGSTEGQHLLNGIGTYKYFDFVETTAAGGENFLVTDISTTTGITSHQGGVPEPASWALMITGFGLAGASLRRRRALSA